MRKFLNGLGVFCSIVLTIALSILIFLYAVVLNIKVVVSKDGLSDTFKQIDVVETLKSIENGTTWEDITQLADKLNLSEEQAEQILNSDKVKKKVGEYISQVLSSTLNDKKVILTKEKVEEFLNIALDEYNKVTRNCKFI